MGWATVAFYFVASVVSLGVFFKKSGRQRAFWLILSVLLFLLAINKELDLQSALTAAGRCLAQAQGWYEDRQSVQILFILVIIGLSILIGLTLAWAMRREFKDIWLALLGLAFLLAFVAIRAAGFHHFDRFIGYEFGNLRVNWILELGGIGMILANAVVLLLRRRRPLR